MHTKETVPWAHWQVYSQTPILRQREYLSMPNFTLSGIVFLHVSLANSHRSENEQLLGAFDRFGGEPGIACKRLPELLAWIVDDKRPLV